MSDAVPQSNALPISAEQYGPLRPDPSIWDGVPDYQSWQGAAAHGNLLSYAMRHAPTMQELVPGYDPGESTTQKVLDYGSLPARLLTSAAIAPLQQSVDAMRRFDAGDDSTDAARQMTSGLLGLMPQSALLGRTEAGAIQSFPAWHGSPHRFEPVEGNPFGQFEDKAIGSGEGAQAFGYGHYIAENKGIASYYRDMTTKARQQNFPVLQYNNVDLKDLPKPVKPTQENTHLLNFDGAPITTESDPLAARFNDVYQSQLRLNPYPEFAFDTTKGFYSSSESDPEVTANLHRLTLEPNPDSTYESDYTNYRTNQKQQRAIFDVENNYNWLMGKSTNTLSPEENLQKAVDLTRNVLKGRRNDPLSFLDDLTIGEIPIQNKSLYRVDVAPDKEKFLDWDNSISGHPEAEEVARQFYGPALSKATGIQMDSPEFEKVWAPNVGNISGQALHEDLAEEYGQVAAAKQLQSAGIAGVKYLDAFSRKGGPNAKQNFVVFDPRDIKITGRNGEMLGLSPIEYNPFNE